jgi:ABC-2 type transport system permease protein
MEKRINQMDDIIGITQDETGQFVLIREGNESGESQWVASQIIDQLNGGTSDVAFEYSDIGTKLSAVSIYGTGSVILMAIVMAGMVIGLNMIDEKEARTISALTVTPMSKMEFIIGKSLIGVVLPVVEAVLILWLIGMTNINFGMILAMTVVSSLVTIIFGFLIGVLSSNQIAGIANMKFLLVFLSVSVVGAMVLPAKQHFLLYWSPIYWSFIGLTEVITNTATWAAIGTYALWISVLTVVVFFLFRGRINQGVTEAE